MSENEKNTLSFGSRGLQNDLMHKKLQPKNSRTCWHFVHMTYINHTTRLDSTQNSPKSANLAKNGTEK